MNWFSFPEISIVRWGKKKPTSKRCGLTTVDPNVHGAKDGGHIDFQISESSAVVDTENNKALTGD